MCTVRVPSHFEPGAYHSRNTRLFKNSEKAANLVVVLGLAPARNVATRVKLVMEPQYSGSAKRGFAKNVKNTKELDLDPWPSRARAVRFAFPHITNPVRSIAEIRVFF